jgi:thrombospondin type 3 repeat protein
LYRLHAQYRPAMMRALAVSLALCACSFDHGLSSAGGSGGAGPDAASGSGSGSATVDSDHDGIPDSIDNCIHVFNPDQHNKDGDDRGDACDVCPHLYDTGADSDNDGVGDACDPRPMDPGDHIAMFEGFYGAVSWSPVIGANTWQYDGTSAHQPNVDGIYQLVRTDLDLGNVFVDVKVRVNALGPSATRKSAGIVLGYQATDDYYFCGLATTGTTAEIDAGKMFSGVNSFDYQSATFAAPMQDSGWTVLQARTSQPPNGDTSLDCVAARGATTGDAQYSTQADAGGPIGLRTNSADASFDYVFVVEVPPPTM